MSPDPVAPRTWTLPLPGFTTPLSLNRVLRMHHMQRYRTFKVWKDTAARMARAKNLPGTPLGGPQLAAFTVVLHYAPKVGGGPDLANCEGCLKPIVDGLVQAGLAADDSKDYYHPSSPIIHPATGEPGRLWLDVIDLGGTP